MGMQKLPKHFQLEIERAFSHQEAAVRHFFAMDIDEANAWRRWLVERSLREPEHKP